MAQTGVSARRTAPRCATGLPGGVRVETIDMNAEGTQPQAAEPLVALFEQIAREEGWQPEA